MLKRRVLQHLERYWQLACRSYNESDWPLATFFAITLIEEVGKVVIMGNAKLGAELDRKSFYRHEEKYVYAVYSTLLVNARVSRIYGGDEARFAKWFTSGELFRIRNRALYMELKETELLAPQEMVPREDAFLLVCIGGEVLAEIQGVHYTGTGPDDWQRLLGEVDAFRRREKPA